jgi:hypothetical protein
MPQEETRLRDGRIVRSESPLNLEMPFSTLDSFRSTFERIFQFRRSIAMRGGYM